MHSLYLIFAFFAEVFKKKSKSREEAQAGESCALFCANIQTANGNGWKRLELF